MSTYNVAIDCRLTLTISLQVIPRLLSLTAPSIVPRTKKSSSGRGIAFPWLAMMSLGGGVRLWGERRGEGEGGGSQLKDEYGLLAAHGHLPDYDKYAATSKYIGKTAESVPKNYWQV